MRRVVAAAIAFGFFAAQIVMIGGRPDREVARVTITGSFIQPWQLSPGARPSFEGLNGRFARMRAVGMDHVILQWSAESFAGAGGAAAVGSCGYFPSARVGCPGDGSSVIDWLFAEADTHGFDVWLGLSRPRIATTPEPYWSNWASDAGWMRRQAEASAAVAADLLARYAAEPRFAGLYVVPELENLSFRLVSGTPTAQLLNYGDYLRRVRSATLGTRLMISPFVNAGARGRDDPAGWTASLRWLVERSGGLDVVALQDGFGPERHLAAHMTTERLPAWLMATRRGIGRAELWANIETYRQVAPSILEAVGPDTLPTVNQQIDLGQGLVDRMTSFSFLTYQLPA